MINLRSKLYILIIMAVVFMTSAINSQPNKMISEGTVVDAISVSIDTNSNGITKTYLVPEIKDYKKITFITGSTNNDSASYVFKLFAGSGGNWQLLWNDTITTLHAKSGAISNSDTSAARTFTLDMTDSTTLYSEFMWERRNLATGNGTGPASNKTKMNDLFIGWKPERAWKP